MSNIFCSRKMFAPYVEAVSTVLGLNDTADIVVDFKKKLDGDAGGYCFGDSESIQIEIATHVQGERCPIAEVRLYIAHEMIHAKQLLEGRLKDHGIRIAASTPKGIMIFEMAQTWLGKTYTNIAYEDAPWEHEAYNLEKSVMLSALHDLQMLKGI